MTRRTSAHASGCACICARTFRCPTSARRFGCSPSLDASIAAWQGAPDSDKGRKAERALVRYFSRMAARPTPFGLFAGCSVGTWGARTDLRLAPRNRHRRHTRLDTDYVAELCETLLRQPDVRRRLRLRPNTTAHAVGDRLRFIEAHTQKHRANISSSASTPRRRCASRSSSPRLVASGSRSPMRSRGVSRSVRPRRSRSSTSSSTIKCSSAIWSRF